MSDSDNFDERLRAVIRDELRRALGSPKPLLSLGEVASVLQVSQRTVRRIIARGDLAVVVASSGRGARVHPDTLDAYVRASSRVGRG